MNTKGFLNWLKCSFEEEPGRSSGKSLLAFFLSFLFGLAFAYVTLHQFFSIIDFKEREFNLIDSFQGSIMWLILGLYGVKGALKTKWLSGNSNDKNTPDTTNNPDIDAKQP